MTYREKAKMYSLILTLKNTSDALLFIGRSVDDAQKARDSNERDLYLARIAGCTIQTISRLGTALENHA